MIPKIIHYCWLSSDPYPDDLQKWMQTWKEKLPDYEFRLWNFNNFDKKLSLWVRQAFENKKYAFAADYIRLFAVYNCGGFYLDMDIEVLKSFDDLLDSDLILAYENDEKTGIEAGCFGAEKGNPVIKECLNYYAGRSFIKEDGTFDILPLPRIMNSIISKYKNILVRSCDYFTAKSFETGKIKLSENTYTIHHFAGSWTSDAQKEYYKKREKYYTNFNSYLGKLLSFFAFIQWQIKDNGLPTVLKKILRKIFE